MCTWTHIIDQSLQSGPLFSWTCFDSCTGERRAITSIHTRLWSLRMRSGKRIASEPVHACLSVCVCMHIYMCVWSRNYTAGIQDTPPNSAPIETVLGARRAHARRSFEQPVRWKRVISANRSFQPTELIQKRIQWSFMTRRHFIFHVLKQALFNTFLK